MPLSIRWRLFAHEHLSRRMRAILPAAQLAQAAQPPLILAGLLLFAIHFRIEARFIFANQIDTFAIESFQFI